MTSQTEDEACAWAERPRECGELGDLLISSSGNRAQSGMLMVFPKLGASHLPCSSCSLINSFTHSVTYQHLQWVLVGGIHQSTRPCQSSRLQTSAHPLLSLPLFHAGTHCHFLSHGLMSTVEDNHCPDCKIDSIYQNSPWPEKTHHWLLKLPALLAPGSSHSS